MIIQTIFYITGIIFFVIIIIAAFIFIRATLKTSTTIKNLLTSRQVDSLISKIEPILARINI